MFGVASITVTRLDGEGSDGGVDGCQDDSEDDDGDRTTSSNVSVEDGEVVSEAAGN